VSTAPAPPASAVRCPVCGQDSPATAQFCIHCHAILIRRCPHCWHEQREGNVCEKCGPNFARCWETALERSLQEENRVQWATFGAGIGAFVQILLLPFASLGGLLRALVARLIAGRLSGR
jgi:hypothetical protein